MERAVKDSDSDDGAVEIRFAVIGALLGPIFLYLAGSIFRDAENAYGLIDYFWSIPAGAITGYLIPSAWPAKKD